MFCPNVGEGGRQFLCHRYLRAKGGRLIPLRVVVPLTVLTAPSRHYTEANTTHDLLHVVEFQFGRLAFAFWFNDLLAHVAPPRFASVAGKAADGKK
jgi:hypothetical protein